ncbi:MAG TPA: tetratricopeptide repeat protein [Flavobacterium sp.]|uniref:tetratricopeptide repeat protein n=1 Tax=Flavobacterium sp. TaxID=239 RepID=UPI002C4487CD|nr:tetratricopeptide repeat protein [Flavobacterium sp.]HNP33220.1 tetratricopeptide repeat protein [Flavobacterium sp.]
MKHSFRLAFLLLFFISLNSFAQTAAQVLAQNGLNKATANDREGAIVDYTKSLELEQNPEVYYKRAIAYMQTRQFAKSLEDFDKAATLKKEDTDFFFLRGKVKSILKDYKGAIQDYDNAIKFKADNGEAYFFRALSKIELKDNVGACKDLKKAVDLKYDKALSTLQSNCK